MNHRSNAQQQHKTTAIGREIRWTASTILLVSACFPTAVVVDAAAADPNTLFSAERSVIVTDHAMGARCAVSADFDGDGYPGKS